MIKHGLTATTNSSTNISGGMCHTIRQTDFVYNKPLTIYNIHRIVPPPCRRESSGWRPGECSLVPGWGPGERGLVRNRICSSSTDVPGIYVYYKYWCCTKNSMHSKIYTMAQILTSVCNLWPRTIWGAAWSRLPDRTDIHIFSWSNCSVLSCIRCCFLALDQKGFIHEPNENMNEKRPNGRVFFFLFVDARTIS